MMSSPCVCSSVHELELRACAVQVHWQGHLHTKRITVIVTNPCSYTCSYLDTLKHAMSCHGTFVAIRHLGHFSRIHSVMKKKNCHRRRLTITICHCKAITSFMTLTKSQRLYKLQWNLSQCYVIYIHHKLWSRLNLTT